MPFVETRFISPTTLTTSASSALYTVPTGYSAIIKQLVVTNTTGTAATFTFYIGAASAGNALFSGTSVAANDTVIINLSQVLTTGETLRALASTGSALNLTVSGVLNDGPLASTATYIADNAITSAKIADGAIVNADINASAAIDQSKIANLTSDLALKAPLASPTLTGTPLAPTAAAGTNTTQLATTAFANTAGGLVFVSSGTFTNVATADITGFSSTYDTYKLDLSYNTAGAITAVLAQLYSGATVRNTSYYGGMWYVNYLGSSGIFAARANAANFYLGDGNSTANPPNLVEATIHGISNLQFAITGTLMDMANTASVAFGFTNYSNPSSFDKIRLIGNSANITGAWTLMGVRKS